MTNDRCAPELKAQYLTSMRALLDLIEANPLLPAPSPIVGFYFVDKETARKVVKAIPGDFEKKYTDYDVDFENTTAFPGLRVKTNVFRSEICKKIIIGERETEVTGPDTSIEDTRPIVTRIVKEQVTEWQCGSLMDDTEDQA